MLIFVCFVVPSIGHPLDSPSSSGQTSPPAEDSSDISDVIDSSVPTTEASLFFDPSAGFHDEVAESLKAGDYGLENPNLFQGDILSDFPSETKTAVRVFNLWPLGIVPYSMQLSLFPMREQINAAMREIEQKTCVKFRPRLLSRDYVNMGSGSGCYSVIGRQGGPQILSLGRGCGAHTTIVHELMHAIGFEHMHSHRDRDMFLKINWENIPTDKWRQFEVVSLLGYKTLVPFDFESVMLYGPKTFGQQGKTSMESKVKGKRVLEMAEKSGLSKGDIDGINRLYMCRRNGAGQMIHQA
jgi:hypothetical protein